jgi:hypothetical protein
MNIAGQDSGKAARDAGLQRFDGFLSGGWKEDPLNSAVWAAICRQVEPP